MSMANFHARPRSMEVLISKDLGGVRLVFYRGLGVTEQQKRGLVGRVVGGRETLTVRVV